MRASSYNIIVPLPDSQRRLVFHGYTGAVDLVQPRVADLLRPGEPLAAGAGPGVSTATIRSLRRRGYLTERSREEETAYAVELGRRVHRVLRRHAAPGVLAVPSYACNLRCAYCYEKPLRANGTAWLSRRMTTEQADALLDAAAVLGRGSSPARSLTFYGGEPFQQGNAPIVRYLHHRARAAGFRAFSAVTNGVELDRFGDLLGPDGGVTFLQITLDGPGEVHDSRRCLPGGHGTFARITANISLALRRGARVSVRMNIDRTNADRVHEVHETVRAHGWDRSPLFQVYCSPVHAQDACSAAGGSCFASHLEMQEAVEQGLAARSAAPPGGYLHVASLTRSVQKRLLEHLRQRQGLPRWRTAFCGSNLSMFVFDPFGDVYPCWEMVGRLEHRIGRYGPGYLEMDEGAARAWHDRSVVEIEGCRACPYLFFCGGGCQAFALSRTGRPDRPHCFEFPRHFQSAAVEAFREWEAARRAPGGAPRGVARAGRRRPGQDCRNRPGPEASGQHAPGKPSRAGRSLP